MKTPANRTARELRAKTICLALSMAFIALVIQFTPDVLAAQETAVSSPGPAATAAASISATPSPTITPEPPEVRWVGVHDRAREDRHADVTYAQRGDDIWLDVINFRAWVDSLGDKKPPDHDIKDLILFLNHVPLKGVPPIYWYETEWQLSPSITTTDTTIGFSLVRNDTSKPGWSHLLNQPVFNR